MAFVARMRMLSSLSWSAPIESDGRVFIPFSDFKPSIYGMKLDGLKLDPSTIDHIGLLATVFALDGSGVDSRWTDGPFSLTIRNILFE
jgi:hypothetical protein